MTTLEVHPQLGLNPRRCICSGCHEDTDEIRSLGAHNYVNTCIGCGLNQYGLIEELCRRCTTPMEWSTRRILAADEKVYGLKLCPKCSEQADAAARMVSDGGVYCHCKKCLKRFAIPATDDLSIRVRNEKDVRPPTVMTVVLGGCPFCG